MIYIKLLEAFLLCSLFGKDEYNFKSKAFNPIKVFTILVLAINLIFTVVLVVKTNKVYTIVEKQCPNVLIELENGKKEEK
jgi:hypothetical protein